MFLLSWLMPPAITAGGTGLRVAVISDLNGAYGSTEYAAAVGHAVARIVALKPDLVISTGDMVAGQRRPHLSRSDVEGMWQAFHAHVTVPLAAAGIALAVTPGNHDGSGYQGFELERAIFAEQWQPRRPALQFVDAGDYPFNYAFSAGEVLFLAVDATKVGHLSDPQMAWIEATLDRHGPRYRWRVVFSHLPVWPFAKGREREVIGDPALQELLRRADVELYLSGHHHAFYPGVKDGITHLSQSCLGAGPRWLLGDQRHSPRSFTLLEFKDGKPSITAFAAPDFTAAIDWAGLPARIRSSIADLVRADLVRSPGLGLEAGKMP